MAALAQRCRSLLPLLLALLALSLLPGFAEAQGYWVVYPSDCPYVCDAAPPSSPYSGYSLCVNQCNACLLYYGCYSSFYPYFSMINNVVTYSSVFSCGCYWPWWAWTILGVGLFLIVFVCLPLFVVYYCCKGALSMMGKKKHPEGMPPQEAQPYASGAAPAPDAYGMPPPPVGKYVE